MTQLSGFEYTEISFNRAGTLLRGGDDLQRLAADPAATDLLVLSHGWNNSAREARRLYQGLLRSMRGVLDDGHVPALAARKIVVCGVFWPSKQFSESELEFGGAASAGSPFDDIRDQLVDLRGVFSTRDRATLDEMAGLVPKLADKATARARFADLARSLLDQQAEEFEDGTVDLFQVSAPDLMERLAIPVFLAPPEGVPAGGAAGLPSLGGGIFGAVRNLLNFATYYEMKKRAGVVGERGLAPVIAKVHEDRPGLRIHLAGHSFGGRLVAAAARGISSGPPAALATVTMLQAAFSHFGFAREWEPHKTGFFRPVIDRRTVSGPILISHTGNDKAVGVAYAIASRIAGQAGAGVGDANDTFGGIGRNGAQRTDEVVAGELRAVGDPYTWRAGKLHNLRADRFISGHSDITGREAGYALLSAIGST